MREIYNGLTVIPLNLEANTIAIKFRDKNARKAADIVNAIASEFNKYDVEKSSEIANKILDFIDNTILQINMDLSNSENRIEQFKKNNRIIEVIVAELFFEIARKTQPCRTRHQAVEIVTQTVPSRLFEHESSCCFAPKLMPPP